MATVLVSPPRSLADVVVGLGGIPLDRIGLPFGTATEKDVLRALELADKRLYELIDGVLVEKAMGIRGFLLAGLLVHYLWEYLERHDVGIAFTADGPIRLKRGRIRIPDAGFVSWERLPNRELPTAAILDAIPDLAAEVISEGNTPKEMERKLEDYFDAGVRLVWLIYPKTQTAMVYTSLTDKNGLATDESLEGGDGLPGFVLPLKKLFARSRRGAKGKRRNGTAK